MHKQIVFFLFWWPQKSSFDWKKILFLQFVFFRWHFLSTNNSIFFILHSNFTRNIFSCLFSMIALAMKKTPRKEWKQRRWWQFTEKTWHDRMKNEKNECFQMFLIVGGKACDEGWQIGKRTYYYYYQFKNEKKRKKNAQRKQNVHITQQPTAIGCHVSEWTTAVCTSVNVYRVLDSGWDYPEYVSVCLFLFSSYSSCRKCLIALLFVIWLISIQLHPLFCCSQCRAVWETFDVASIHVLHGYYCFLRLSYIGIYSVNFLKWQLFSCFHFIFTDFFFALVFVYACVCCSLKSLFLCSSINSFFLFSLFSYFENEETEKIMHLLMSFDVCCVCKKKIFILFKKNIYNIVIWQCLFRVNDDKKNFSWIVFRFL